MILHHGTNIDFDTIDLKKSKPNKDFGKGFYLSADYDQAMAMANVKVEQLELDMTKNLAVLLMEDNPNLTMEQALSAVLNSDTYQRIQNERTHLFYQSPRYVYSFLVNEFKTGRM